MRLHRQKGVTAQIKEAVLRANLGHAEDTRPDCGDVALDRVGGRDRFGGGCGARCLDLRFWRRQRLAVHLAVGGEGEVIQHDDMRGDHVGGQMRGQMRARGLWCDRAAQIGHETHVAGGILARQHHRLRDAGAALKCGLDLAQFDAIAAQFHLCIGASDEIEPPIGAPAHQIAGAVDAPACAKRIGAKAVRCQIVASKIAARDAIAANPELACDADRRRLHVGVQNIRLRIDNGCANGAGAGGVLCGAGGGPDGRFGGAIHIGHARARDLPQVLHQSARQRLAAQHQMPQPTEGVTGFFVHGDHARHGRGALQMRHAVPQDLRGDGKIILGDRPHAV